ncbi:hypothetical protein ACWPKS_08500 [Coraliomargarita sp. W4R72]
MESISKIRDELKLKYPKRYKTAKALLFLYVFVFVLSVIYWSILFPMGIAGYKAEEFGQWGDAFGFWNSLFSGAALILVVISVYLQNEEISEIGKSMKTDGFERTFFNVLDIIAQSRNYVIPFKKLGQYKDGEPPIKSVAHALFSGARNNTLERWDFSIADCIKDDTILEHEVITKIANDFFTQNDYMVLSFINAVECALELLFDYTDDEKLIDKYGLLIRTILINYELDVLAVYGAMDGSETFRDRTNKIKMFSDVDSKLWRAMSLDHFYDHGKVSEKETE